MSASPSDHAGKLGLRPGELVRVRSPREIFSTLDQQGRLDGLPFMPEMLPHCGKTFPVFKRADKTCGESFTWMRRLHDTVHLSGVRCDGTAHGGCQAACLMYWKEAWLQRVRSDGTPPSARNGEEERFVTDVLLPATTDGNRSERAETVYRCQVTQLPHASTQLRVWHVDQYVRDVRNWTLSKVLRGLAIYAFNRVQSLSRRFLPRRLLIRNGQHYPFVAGRLEKHQTPTADLRLQPGDVVRIKSRDEIIKTLDRTNKNRGLSFDPEMLKYCGRIARVHGRVERLLDEQTGKMVHIKRDCIVLEGVVCKADYNLFCTRSTFPYWREVWLDKLSSAAEGVDPPSRTAI